MGYHITPIKRGVLGELSKIREELDEAFDAETQGNELMVLLELSDMYGAMRAYLESNHPTFVMSDLEVMSDATKRAFLDGTRESR